MMASINLPLYPEGGLAQYIQKIKSFPVLSAEEEFALANRWYNHANLKDAHKLVTSHLRLVVKIASGFKNYGLPLLELIMEGNIGLMQAVKKFNPTLGFRLATYAIWWIKASIKDYILKSWSVVKIGTTQAQRKLFFSLRKIRNSIAKYDDMSKSLSAENIKKIASECSVSPEEVVNMERRLSLRDKSLNDSICGKDGEAITELQEILPSNISNQEESFIQKEEELFRKQIIQNALSQLNERQRDIFIKRRLQDDPETLDTLSKKYSISRERVRQIESSAFLKVKEYIKNKITANQI